MHLRPRTLGARPLPAARPPDRMMLWPRNRTWAISASGEDHRPGSRLLGKQPGAREPEGLCSRGATATLVTGPERALASGAHAAVAPNLWWGPCHMA